MKTTKRSWIIRIAFVLVLVLVAVLMLRIGRGHTVYFDNRALDKDGQSVAAPYKITVYVNGEQISKLYDKERCMVTDIGDRLELTVEVMQQKGGSETTETYQADAAPQHRQCHHQPAGVYGRSAGGGLSGGVHPRTSRRSGR